MAKSELTAAERARLKSILADPQQVATWLDDIQYTACAGLLKFPQLVPLATAHIFDSTDQPIYLGVFLALKRGEKPLQGVFKALLAKGWPLTCAEQIAGLWWHPVTIGVARMEIEALKKFIAWQYRQEKAKRNAA